LSFHLVKRFPHSTPIRRSSTALQSLERCLSRNELTQEAMLRPVTDFVPIKDSFAIIHVGGHQYKVTEGDEIMTEKLEAPVLTQILLDKVLLVGTKNHTVVGTPLLDKAKVLAEVQEQSKTERIWIYKKTDHKRKKRKGHRQPYTLLKIIDVMVAKE